MGTPKCSPDKPHYNFYFDDEEHIHAKNPKLWIVDAEAAAIVKHIFALCLEGRGPFQIATQLKMEQVLSPSAYQRSQ